MDVKSNLKYFYRDSIIYTPLFTSQQRTSIANGCLTVDSSPDAALLRLAGQKGAVV
jgi:hypothetical protein